jgi:hypothetical protein
MQRLGVLCACSTVASGRRSKRGCGEARQRRLDVIQGGDDGVTVSEAWRGLATRGSRFWLLLIE